MGCISHIEYQLNRCYSSGTNGANGRLECTPTQPEDNKNILRPHNVMHFTIRISMLLYVALYCPMLP